MHDFKEKGRELRKIRLGRLAVDPIFFILFVFSIASTFLLAFFLFLLGD